MMQDGYEEEVDEELPAVEDPMEGVKVEASPPTAPASPTSAPTSPTSSPSAPVPTIKTEPSTEIGPKSVLTIKTEPPTAPTSTIKTEPGTGPPAKTGPSNTAPTPALNKAPALKHNPIPRNIPMPPPSAIVNTKPTILPQPIPHPGLVALPANSAMLAEVMPPPPTLVRRATVSVFTILTFHNNTIPLISLQYVTSLVFFDCA